MGSKTAEMHLKYTKKEVTHMDFSQLLRRQAQFTHTTNGAPALMSTGNALLNMFSTVAACRGRTEKEIIHFLDAAWQADPLGALRCMFYVRDVRGGQGERDIFRAMLNHAATRYTEALRPNVHLIPEYGRWDDMYFLIGTPLEEDMWKLVRAQLDVDIEQMEAGKPVSLLAKWLKKANSQSETTKRLGIYTAQKLGMSVYDYKRVTARLRKHMGVVEIAMSAGDWGSIAYEGTPSRAMMIYRKAFRLHDQERYEAYLAAVAAGERKINASTLYPYDIVEKYLRDQGDATLEAQWKALPDYVQDGDNILVMADVSGSMCGRPMASSIALAMYFAKRCQGATFSEQPALVELQGNTLEERISFLHSAPWGMNTDFMAAMKLILDVAVRNHVPQKQLPRALVVVTDMQFDAATRPGQMKETFTELCQAMFAAQGYTAPVLVFWNVNSTSDVFHADAASSGIVLVSGQSASTFENILRFLRGEDILTPVDFMYQVLGGERYAAITLPAG